MLSGMSDKLTIPDIGRMSESEARALLESVRWPDGPVCPHCGVVGEATAMESRADTSDENKMRDGLYNCRACGRAFTVTVGTIFEGSHIPISKWLMGFYLYATSKKSLSALQLQRQLGLGSYRTAWHMAHRIRHAMANGGPVTPLAGIIEVDETYVGGKPRRWPGEAQKGKLPPGAPPRKRGRGSENKVPVQVLVQRDGAARARVVADVREDTLTPYIKAHAAKTATIHSDEFRSYTNIGRHFGGRHETVSHGRGEYARGDVHVNSAESFNGLFKRGVVGAWHAVSREHLDRYLDEFTYRWSHRKESDADRTRRALRQSEGVRLYYRKPKGQEGQGGQGLVAGS